MSLFTKQKQTRRHRKQIYGYQREKGVGQGQLRIQVLNLINICLQKTQRGLALPSSLGHFSLMPSLFTTIPAPVASLFLNTTNFPLPWAMYTSWSVWKAFPSSRHSGDADSDQGYPLFIGILDAFRVQLNSKRKKQVLSKGNRVIFLHPPPDPRMPFSTPTCVFISPLHHSEYLVLNLHCTTSPDPPS